MFSQRACGPLVERLEERRLFSGHFVAPDGSPYLYGRYTMTLNADPSDPTQFSEGHVVTIKKHDGPSFGGWV